MSPFLPLLLAAAAAAGERIVQPEDAYSLSEIGEVSASPDGSVVLFIVSSRDVSANKVTTRLMRLEGTGSPAAVAGVPDEPSTIRWSPDGKRAAFLASKDKEQAIWTLDARTSVVKRVCAFDRSNHFHSRQGNPLEWSPDGTRLAFAGTAEPKPATADPMVVTRIQYKTRTSFSDNRRTHIFVVPATGGTPKPLTTGDFDEHSLSWGGDGSEIVFLSNRGRDPDANFNYDIFAVNVSTRSIRRMTETPGVEMEPAVSPDGRWIAYSAMKRDRTTIDSVAEDSHIWIVPFAGGAARELYPSLDKRSSGPQWSRDGKEILFLAQDRGRNTIYRVPAAGGRASPVLSRDAQISPFAAAGSRIVFAMSDAATPREVYARGGDLTEPRRLTSLNQRAVENWKLAAPEEIRFPSFDGQQVHGWLYPPVAPAGPKWPLILVVHGGPHGMHGYGFNANFQAYASRGYGVLALNPRGSAGYGQRFSDGSLNDWGGGDYRDLMAGVDHVLATHPQIDPQRLGITGTSYGGFMTNWAVTQTDRFRAGVAGASLSNLISFYATSLYQDLVHVEFNGFPWEGRNFETLWKWSPLAYIKNVKTPVLLLHGEQDNDVHITQAEEMYTALRYRGIDSVLVRYPREGHGFREPKHQVDALKRTLDWMDRYLKP